MTMQRTGSRRRHWLVVLLAATALAAGGALPGIGQSAAADDGPTTRMIVVGRSAVYAHDRVNARNGNTRDELETSSSVVADLTASEASALRSDGDVVLVPNVQVDVLADPVPTTAPPRLPAAVFAESTGARASGLTGSGVTVAVLDTGITRVADFGSRVVGGVDLSGEGDPYRDSYGHGTFVSGIIAGNGASSGGQYAGEAPGASLVAVKVAGAKTTLIVLPPGASRRVLKVWATLPWLPTVKRVASEPGQYVPEVGGGGGCPLIGSSQYWLLP